jgi:hypothetical protein
MDKINILVIIFIIILLVVSSFNKRWEDPEIKFFFIKRNKFINEVYTKKNKDKKDPIQPPEGFKWSLIDVNNIEELYELRRFLNKNYLSGGSYLCDNSIDMLRNSLYKRQQLSLRYVIDNRIVGFIGRIPYKLKIYDKLVDSVEISYFSLHKKTRYNNFAPLLIREVTRMTLKETNNSAAAIFVTSFEIPKYNKLLNFNTYFRPLNYKKLTDINILPFIYRYDDISKYEFDFDTSLLKEEDIEECCNLYRKYQEEKYDIYYSFDYDAFKLFFYDHNEIKTYVVKDENNKITDFFCIGICTYKSKWQNLLYGKILGYANYSVSLKKLIKRLIYDSFNLNLQYLISSGFGEVDDYVDDCGFILQSFSGRLYLYNWLATPTKKERVYINFNG